ncbi:hypothetical protein [Halalkalibacterium halodurans]|jgi:hypothetical protein|uniref:Uncharacterized protein n=1 Tax=Halalkalibacterium halodurans TaxID=86665 RepID=A0A0M0KIX3_ALKHA|nr:hypothetical protein [Halalkalibacterium halodurans]MED4162989.1 hypothetical protein [Halalkalibacterium halodurans]TPE67134.1 hypothetical protein AMD02_017870 [Halalkalibacterium halodurans]
MKRFVQFSLISLFIALFAGCQAGEPDIIGDIEESYISWNDERGQLTIFARLLNESSSDANNLTARFEFDHPLLKEQISEEGYVVFSSNGEPIPFSVSGDGTYFLSESFDIDWEVPIEELAGDVSVTIFDRYGNEIAHFTIEHAIEE